MGPPQEVHRAHRRSSSMRRRATLAAVDDPFDDLGVERAWVRRISRRLAEQRSRERAAARAETLAARAELAAPPVESAKRTLSPTQLAQLAAVRAHRWAGVDAAARRAFMGRLAALRWRKTTAAQRHQVGIMLGRARWHPPSDPTVAPGGGRYR